MSKNETDDKKEMRKAKDAKYQKEKRAAENWEERNDRLSQIREYYMYKRDLPNFIAQEK